MKMGENIEQNDKPFNIAIVGLGGQGVITLTKLIASTSFGLGKKVCFNEIHGLSQRGGSVQSLIRLNEAHNPIFAAEDVDLVIGMEKLETIRYLYLAKKANPRVIMTNKYDIRSTHDLGLVTFPDEQEIDKEIARYASEVYLFDALGYEENFKGKFKPLNVPVFAILTTFPELGLPEKESKELVLDYLGRNMFIRQINKKAFEEGPKWLKKLEGSS